MLIKGANALLLNEATVALAIADYVNRRLVNTSDAIDVTTFRHEDGILFRATIVSRDSKVNA